MTEEININMIEQIKLHEQKKNHSIEVENLFQIKEHIGEIFESEQIFISEEQVRKFLEVSGDANPIHFDREQMSKSVLNEEENDNIIVPGDLTYILTKNKKTLFEALKIKESTETISGEINGMKWLRPVFANSEVVYEYKLEKAEDVKIKSKLASKVTFGINVYRIDNNKKIRCMKADYTVIYVSI